MRCKFRTSASGMLIIPSDTRGCKNVTHWTGVFEWARVARERNERIEEGACAAFIPKEKQKGVLT